MYVACAKVWVGTSLPIVYQLKDWISYINRTVPKIWTNCFIK